MSLGESEIIKWLSESQLFYVTAADDDELSATLTDSDLDNFRLSFCCKNVSSKEIKNTKCNKVKKQILNECPSMIDDGTSIHSANIVPQTPYQQTGVVIQSRTIPLRIELKVIIANV
ncbi:hypothetical protein TKK_0015602 [Trichogramma kaykai]